jgi:hypothetical protein
VCGPAATRARHALSIGCAQRDVVAMKQSVAQGNGYRE